MRTIATLLMLFAFPALADVAPHDPPSRVGRVAWTQGEVAAWIDPDRGWEKAYVNTPLTSENSLWTEPGARAELRIGSTALRLDEATQLDMRRLDDEQLRAHVVRGALAVRIRHFERGERYLVSTPGARFLLQAAGRYRIDADEAIEESRLTVFSGSAQLEIDGRRVGLAPGQAVRVSGEGLHFEFERAAATDFDQWALARDERLAGRQSARHLSPRMTGYEDLDEHGEWGADPEYGTVWYPTRVAADWAPYRDGHWAWHRPWGWTWIDHAPWGYAPFHYGRWALIGHRWAWCPGRYVQRPVWAPALVGFVGRPGWSVTIGSGRAPVVAWYPLAPWDRYQPWYTSNVNYITNVNVIVVNRPPGHVHRDRDPNRHRGTTVVLREGFVGQRPVAQALAPVSGEALALQPVASAQAVLPVPGERPRPRPLELSRPSSARSPVGGQAASPAVPAPSPAPLTAPASTIPPRAGAVPLDSPAAVSPPALRGEPAGSRPATPARTVREARPDMPAPVVPAYRAPVGGQPAPESRPHAAPERVQPGTPAVAPARARPGTPAAAPVHAQPAAPAIAGGSPAAPPAKAPESRGAGRPAAKPGEERAEKPERSEPTPAARPERGPRPAKD